MFKEQLVKRLQTNRYKWGYNVFTDDRPLQGVLSVILRINSVTDTNILSGDRRMFDGYQMTYDIHIISKESTGEYEQQIWELLNTWKCKPQDHNHMSKLDGNVHHAIETSTWIGSKWRVNDDTEQL